MKKREKAAAAAVTVAAAAGMVTGTLFDTPVDLLAEPDAVVETVQADDEDAGAPVEKQRGLTARLRAWVLRLPAAVRMLVGVPLWCLGWVLLTGLSTLWAGAAAPLSRLLNWLCLALILLAVFGAAVKSAFPALPLKTIFRPRNVLFLLGMTLLLALADMALPTVWEGYDAVSRTVWRLGAACLLAFVCCAALKRQGKKAEQTAVSPTVSKRTEVEEPARALADTVCPR